MTQLAAAEQHAWRQKRDIAVAAVKFMDAGYDPKLAEEKAVVALLTYDDAGNAQFDLGKIVAAVIANEPLPTHDGGGGSGSAFYDEIRANAAKRRPQQTTTAAERMGYVRQSITGGTDMRQDEKEYQQRMAITREFARQVEMAAIPGNKATVSPYKRFIAPNDTQQAIATGMPPLRKGR